MNHKTLIFIAVIFTSFFNCKNTDHIEPEINLSGKKFEYNYGDFVYEIVFKSNSSLEWNCTQGEDKGKNGIEKYSFQKLDKNLFFISWIEKDGLGVSQVVNFKENKINTFLKQEKEIISLSGTIRELK